jgi:hypothetical protein
MLETFGRSIGGRSYGKHEEKLSDEMQDVLGIRRGSIPSHFKDHGYCELVVS